MNTSRIFYLCPTCFEVSESEMGGHRHRVIRVDPGEPDDERRKPAMDEAGRLTSRAPRWFLEAIGSLPPRHTPSALSLSGATR